MSPNHSTSQAEVLAIKYPSIRLEQLPSSRWIILDQPLTPFWWAHFDTEFEAYQAWDTWAESIQSILKHAANTHDALARHLQP